MNTSTEEIIARVVAFLIILICSALFVVGASWVLSEVLSINDIASGFAVYLIILGVYSLMDWVKFLWKLGR